MDGLMFDTESSYSIVMNQMAEKRGKPFTNEFKKTLMGKLTMEVMITLNDYWGLNEDVHELLKEQDADLIKLYENSDLKLHGLDELLYFLNQNNIRKCIGTSSRYFLVMILLERYNLTDAFEFIISGDMIEKGKPHPEIYSRCTEKLDILPDECIVLEDSLNGVKAGVAAGCATCAIPSEYTKDEDFSIATLTCKSLNDIRLFTFLNS